MIVAISGLLEDAQGRKRIAGAGKDEAAKALVENGFVSVAFADEMKRFCQRVYGFTDAQCWGASEERTRPDKRYPREHGPFNLVDSKEMTYACACCGNKVSLRDPGARGGVKHKENGYLWQKDELMGEVYGPCYLTSRYALQKLGTEWGRDCYVDTWVSLALQTAKKLLVKPLQCRYTPQDGLCYDTLRFGSVALAGEPKGAVIPDCRFQSEFRRVKEEGGIVLRVKRYVTEFTSKLDDSHVSERDILAWGDEKFDHVIKNNGTVEELHSKVLAALLGRVEAFAAYTDGTVEKLKY
jgi:hypothetical protein